MSLQALAKSIAEKKTLLGVNLPPKDRHFPASPEVERSPAYWKGRYDALDELAQEILSGRYDV